MNLEELRKNWEVFAETDPLWAIMSDPRKRNGRWELADFFGTGQRQIDETFGFLDEKGVEVRRGKALDFGCGVGRLTQALGEKFETCYGVDLCSNMLEGARRYNRHGERCRYFHNTQNDLKLFEDNTFDFIVTTVVLQHMTPELARNYIREFVRVLAPGGVLNFQMTADRLPPAAPQEPAPEKDAGGSGGLARHPCTASDAPLNRSGARADLFVMIPPVVLAAGETERLQVEVQNLGDENWPARGGPDWRGWITIGNHWLDADGSMVIHDDGRSPLPHDVAPGQTVTIALDVKAPLAPGRYILELDMVQESVTWFATMGSQTTRIKVNVAPPAEAFRPRIEMYLLAPEDVIALVESGGGRVLHQVEYPMSEWLSVNYYATK
jgi:SAM-dependent methyltransferase